MAKIEKGDSIPDADHVLRYVKNAHFDKAKNKLDGEAFEPRPNEKNASVNWLEYYSPPLDDQIRKVIRAKRNRFTYMRNGIFVRLRVGDIRRVVARETQGKVELSVIWVPLDADPTRDYDADPSHAEICQVAAEEAGGSKIGFIIREYCEIWKSEAANYIREIG
jgi:hypothetical protein